MRFYAIFGLIGHFFVPKKPRASSHLIYMKNLIVAFAISLVVLSAGVQATNAGPLDWIKEKTPAPIIKSQSFSLDNVYASLQSSTEKKSPSAVQEHSVTPATSVITPVTKSATSSKIIKVVATGYSSTVDQTDDSPFITASGTYVRDGVVAANFLPIGTRIKIPDQFGDKIFVVEDRMNKRYWHRVDVWFPARQAALNFGVRTVTIEIVS